MHRACPLCSLYLSAGNRSDGILRSGKPMEKQRTYVNSEFKSVDIKGKAGKPQGKKKSLEQQRGCTDENQWDREIGYIGRNVEYDTGRRCCE